MNIVEKETEYINEINRRTNGCFTFIIGCCLSFVFGVLVGIIYDRHNTSTPIERNNVIDSLTAVNDSIKIKIEKLDSIKNAKVIEVSTLDNDSTLKLFYELVSE